MNWKKNWKVLGAALLVTAACAAFAGCGGGEKAASAENEVKLGFINGTSGGVAAYGLSEKKGFDMAIAELNAKGPYHFPWRKRIRRASWRRPWLWLRK